MSHALDSTGWDLTPYLPGALQIAPDDYVQRARDELYPEGSPVLLRGLGAGQARMVLERAALLHAQDQADPAVRLGLAARVLYPEALASGAALGESQVQVLAQQASVTLSEHAGVSLAGAGPRRAPAGAAAGGSGQSWVLLVLVAVVLVLLLGRR